MFVGSLDQEGAGLGVLASFNESVLLFSELMLVNGIGVSEVFFGHIIQAVEGVSSASED